MKVKNTLVASVASLGLVFSVANAEESKELTTKEEKLSYTIGVDMGNNFRDQSIEIDEDVFLLGLQHGQNEEQTLLMTQEEMEASLMDLQQELIAKYEEQRKELSEKNSSEGEAFLTENAQEAGVVVLESGLQYKILEEGDGIIPTVEDTVSVSYEGRLLDGTIFDKSDEEPVTFGVSRVIQGWTEALTLMPEGSTWELYVPAKLAYGEMGIGSEIGPNQLLIFKVTLEKIEPKQLES